MPRVTPAAIARHRLAQTTLPPRSRSTTTGGAGHRRRRRLHWLQRHGWRRRFEDVVRQMNREPELVAVAAARAGLPVRCDPSASAGLSRERSDAGDGDGGLGRTRCLPGNDMVNARWRGPQSWANRAARSPRVRHGSSGCGPRDRRDGRRARCATPQGKVRCHPPTAETARPGSATAQPQAAADAGSGDRGNSAQPSTALQAPERNACSIAHSAGWRAQQQAPQVDAACGECGCIGLVRAARSRRASLPHVLVAQSRASAGMSRLSSPMPCDR